jgi:prevent-host-death family protein
MSKTKTKGVEVARKSLPSLLEQASRGTRTIITKHGAPYAAIVPVSDLLQQGTGVDIRALRGSGKGLWGANSRATIQKMRREWR